MGECNPQAENGHVDIANEIVEALARTPLSGNEFRVLFALFRKTYGWHRKEDRISLTQFQAITGLTLPKISNTLNRLRLRKMVTVTDNGNGKTKSYCFQKVFTLWQGLPKQVLPEMGISETGITKSGVQGLPESISTKETITKEKNLLLVTFEEKKERILEMFPWINYEAEKEKCVHYYREKTLLDPWQVILAWLGKIPKTEPREQAPVISLEEARAAQIADLIEKGVLEPGDYPPAKREGAA
jgi:phage replication O-like protein O